MDKAGPGLGVVAVEKIGVDEDLVIEPVSLEFPRPLSQTLLWNIQHDYWERGPLAWSSGDVPFLLTTAPVVARTYARLIEGFVTDVAAGRFGDFDAAEPVYVIDVGSGNGRLAYYILRALDHEYMAPTRVVYVMADRARANLDFCLDHPKMAPFLDAGRADVAMYDAEKDESLVLEKLGVELAPDRIANPLVGINNYLMCVVPHDAFSVIDGKIYEDHVEVIAENSSVKPSSPTFFNDIFVARYHVPFVHGRYGERLDAVVEKVAAERGPEHQFLFPADGIRLVDNLRQLAGGRAMVIVGDRQEFEREIPVEGPNPLPDADGKPAGGAGVIQTQAYRPTELYGMGTHGACISLPPDFGVLATAAELAGCDMLRNPDLPTGLTVGVVLSGETSPARHVRKNFRDFALAPAPDDLWYTAHLVAVEDAPLEGLIAELRVSDYDSDVFLKVYPGLEQLLKVATGRVLSEALLVLDRIHDRDYRVDSNDDLAFGIGILLAKSGLWSEAIAYFDRSKASVGPRPQTCFNAAMCHLHLEDRETALAELDAAVALDAGYELAKTIRAKVLAGETFE